jgi:hypothetical protein
VVEEFVQAHGGEVEAPLDPFVEKSSSKQPGP